MLVVIIQANHFKAKRLPVRLVQFHRVDGSSLSQIGNFLLKGIILKRINATISINN